MGGEMLYYRLFDFHCHSLLIHGYRSSWTIAWTRKPRSIGVFVKGKTIHQNLTCSKCKFSQISSNNISDSISIIIGC